MLSRKELVDPSGLSEEQLKEIPYTKIEWVFVRIFLFEYTAFYHELCYTEMRVGLHVIPRFYLPQMSF